MSINNRFEQILNFLIHLPMETDSFERKFKYPCVGCEILSIPSEITLNAFLPDVEVSKYLIGIPIQLFLQRGVRQRPAELSGNQVSQPGGVVEAVPPHHLNNRVFEKEQVQRPDFELPNCSSHQFDERQTGYRIFSFYSFYLWFI